MTNITASNLLILAHVERKKERKKRKKGFNNAGYCAADVLSHSYAYKNPPYSKEALSCQHTQLQSTDRKTRSHGLAETVSGAIKQGTVPHT